MTQTASFSNEDVNLVLSTWNIARHDLRSVGVDVFKKMFEQYPHYHSLFKKFSHVSIEDLPKNAVFVRHATNVTEVLDKAFKQLENLEAAADALKNIGKTHSNKNMDASHFIHCNEALMIVLKSNLEEKFNNDVEAAWNKLLPAIVSLIEQGMISEE